MTATRQAQPVCEVPLPVDARALCTLPRIDYSDAFTVTVGVQRTPDQWVQAVIGDAPAHVRRRLFLGWLALGLRLGPPWSGRRVLGWRVQHSDDRYMLLTASSWYGFRGQLLFRGEPDGLLFATLIQLSNPWARRLWAAISQHHQLVVRSLLTHAGNRCGSD